MSDQDTIEREFSPLFLVPDKYESGTHNTPGIVGLNEGVKFIFKEGIDKIKEHEEELCKYMLERLEEIPNIKIYGLKCV